MSVRRRLIKTRESHSLRQEDIAQKLGITQQTVSLIETGKRDPSLQLAKKFELLYDIPMEELFPDIFLELQTTDCNTDN